MENHQEQTYTISLEEIFPIPKIYITSSVNVYKLVKVYYKRYLHSLQTLRIFQDKILFNN